MVFTAAQTTSFFEDADQMGLAHRTRVFLQGEGITTVEDLSEFTSDDVWKQIVANARKPPQTVNAAGDLVDQAPFQIGAKALQRLKVAAIAVEYYASTARPLTAGAMVWNSRLKNFEKEYEVIKSMKSKDGGEVPKITKNVGIAKFLEAYENFTKEYIGVRSAPLAYVIRVDANVPNPAPPLAPDQP